MLLFQNIEGDSYNPILDNYLVVTASNYANTAFDELQSLLDLIANSHGDLVMVECDAHSFEIFSFMENISKLVVCRVVQKANQYYLTIQKSVLD